MYGIKDSRCAEVTLAGVAPGSSDRAMILPTAHTGDWPRVVFGHGTFWEDGGVTNESEAVTRKPQPSVWPACEPKFAGLVRAVAKHWFSVPDGLRLGESLLQPSMFRYGLLLERLALLAGPGAARRDHSDLRPTLLASALQLILCANGLHAKPGLSSGASPRTLRDVLSTSERVLLGDYLMSYAFKLLVQIGDIRVLRRFADAAVSMAESDVQALATTEIETEGPRSNSMTVADRGLGVLAGAALEAAVCLGARLGLSMSEAETLGRRIGLVHLLLNGYQAGAQEVHGLDNHHADLQYARISCSTASESISRHMYSDAAESEPEGRLLLGILDELGVRHYSR